MLQPTTTTLYIYIAILQVSLISLHSLSWPAGLKSNAQFVATPRWQPVDPVILH